MVIISKTTLKDFSKRHSDAEAALENWYQLTSNADWGNFSEMKNTFNSVDAAGNDRYVFNIKGNNYRLIVDIEYRLKIVFIVWFGTHKQYDQIDAKTISYVKAN